jgi:hypothetical protein
MSQVTRLTAALVALAVTCIAPALASGDAGRPFQPPRLEPDPAAVAMAKARGDRSAAKASPGTAKASAPAGTDAVLAGSGLNQPGLTDANWTPSDATGAIGTSHYVEMVEERVATYDRKLNLVSSFPLNQFFGTPDGVGCEGQVIWDQGTKRFYYAGLDCDASATTTSTTAGRRARTRPTSPTAGAGTRSTPARTTRTRRGSATTTATSSSATTSTTRRRRSSASTSGRFTSRDRADARRRRR